jgi:hypothetical protein
VTTERDEEFWYNRGLLRRQEQMHVVGHEYVGMQAALRLGQCLAQPMQVAAIVILMEEARLAIMSPLHDVQWLVVQVNTRPPWHRSMLAK